MIRKVILIATFFILGEMVAQDATSLSYQEVFIKNIESPLTDYNSYLLNKLNLGKEYSFVINPSTTFRDELGFEHTKVQQFFKGVKIADATINLHCKKGVINSINGEYLSGYSSSVTPTFSEEQAFELVLSHVNASEYYWQIPENNSTRPIGELVITKKILENSSTADFYLAYKYDIYSTNPMSRKYIYLDANENIVLREDNLIQECFSEKNDELFAKKTLVLGTAQTRYSGSRNIETTYTGSGYKLADSSRGSGVETYNLNNGSNYSTATNFIDNDNNWTAAEWNNANKDNAALDAHWGAEMTYDYFLQKHGRNSFNNAGAKIKSYIHYSTNYFNAFWNGSVMTYGDGSSLNSFNPLTSVDIAAHEIGHAVCTYSSNLTYSYEPGALNESFSDIWGACVEYFADSTKQTWQLGEDISYIIRSFSNPNSHNQPDTYLGTYWYTGSGDNGGVHTNSGVQNFWFYLLSVGGSGINDFSTTYNVTGIGIDKAAKIAYRAETVYLTPSSNYNQAKTYSIIAAEDLYGVGSPEARSTEKAWCAVGIGNCPCLNNVIISGNYTTPVTESSSWIKSNSTTTILTGTIVKLDAEPVNGFIQFNDGFSTQAGSVLIARALDGCGSALPTRMSSNTDFVNVDVKEKETKLIDRDLSISPNPSNGLFKIESLNSLQSIEVYDITGKTIWKKTDLNKDTNSFDVDLSTIQNGIYLIKINDTVVKKIVKQ